MRDYYGIIYADGDGFTLIFPDLPGCVHHSKNMVEAVAAGALSALLANLARSPRRGSAGALYH